MRIVSGTPGNDTLFPEGEGEDITFLGLAGSDRIFPSGGSDTINGGDGVDMADYGVLFHGQPLFVNGTNVNLSTGEAVFLLNGEVIRHVLIDIEVLGGTRFADVLVGDDADNELQGGSGDDVLIGLGGDDRLFPDMGDDTVDGGDGTDELFASFGNDTLDGGAGDDWVHFLTTIDRIAIFTEGANVDLATGIATARVDGMDYVYTLQNIENAQGSIFDDILIGDAGDNFLSGLSGDDFLSGGDGDDSLFPDVGNDTIDGGAGEDRLDLYFGSFDSGVTIDIPNGIVRGTVNGVDFLQTFVNIEAYRGTVLDDFIIGSDADEILGGDLGNDTIFGGGGDDEIYGSGGDDLSIYLGASHHFTVQLNPAEDSVSIIDRTGAEGTDTSGTNTLRFEDRDLTLLVDGEIDIGEVAFTQSQFEELVELYIAYFNRAPDAEGLHFWARAVVNGTDLDQAAEYFFDQPETRALYGTDLDTVGFVTSVYNNVLGRGPDEAGRSFWVDLLENGSVTEGQFIRDFLQGARAEPAPGLGQDFINQQNADRAYLDAKTDIGIHFGATRGMSDVAHATEVMALFDGTAESRNAAELATEDYYSDALATDGSGELLIQLVGVLDDPMV